MNTNSSSKSAQISALVQELQAGKITKAELFDKLQQLQRAAVVASSSSSSSSSSTPAVSTNNVNNSLTNNIQPIAVVPPPVPPTTVTAGNTSTVSSNQNPSVVQTIVQSALQPSVIVPGATSLPSMITINGVTMPLQQYIQQQQAIMTNAILEAASKQTTVLTNSNNSIVPPMVPILSSSNSSASAPSASLNSSSTASSSVIDATLYQSYARSVVQPRAVSRSSRNGSISGQQNDTSPTYPDQYNTSRRRSNSTAPRTARKSIIGAGELEECTFHPKVNPLPAQYTIRQNNGTPFQERVVAWERAKRDEARRQADERRHRELEECTFQPTINDTSREVALARGHGRPGDQIHERLYKEHEKKHPNSSSRTNGNNNSAIGFATSLLNDTNNKTSPNRGRSTSRLSLLTSGRPLFTSSGTGSPLAPLDRNHINDAILSAEAQALLNECTFAPHVNPVIDAKPVRSRYRDPTNQRSLSRPRPAPTGSEECTFKPKTNPVRPSAMPAAALYVQAPIYDRLARTQTRSQRQREAIVAKERSKLEHSENDSQSQRSISPSIERSEHASVTSEQKEERAKRLTEFLLRQEEAVRKRQADIESLKEATAPTLQPALCEKSLRIVEERGMIPFLERITHDKLIKQQETHRHKALHSIDPECTFHPAINPTSRTLKSRSVEELSRGDALKRETAARMVKLRLEQEDLGGVTFQPKINEKSKHTESRLRILSDPDSYVQRLKQEAAVLAERARRSNAETEMMEMAECTFHPAVHPAPEYVSRIAASMSLARAVKPQPPPARPDWR